MQINDYLTEQAIEFESLLHPPAYSAQMRAKTLHVPGNQVAKSVLLRHEADFLLAVLPATHHIDTARLSDILQAPVRLATDAEIAHLFDNCEWGVVPPFGKLYGLTTILEDSIPPESGLIFEGSTHVEAIRIRCADYEKLEQPRRLAFARRLQNVSIVVDSPN